MMMLLTNSFFVALLIGTAGNCGAQISTLMVESLGSKNLKPTDYVKCLVKEVFVGFMLAIALAISGFIVAAWLTRPEIGLVVALTMVCIIMLSNLVGVSLPFAFAALRMDAAVGSAPIITSLLGMLCNTSTI